MNPKGSDAVLGDSRVWMWVGLLWVVLLNSLDQCWVKGYSQLQEALVGHSLDRRWRTLTAAASRSRDDGLFLALVLFLSLRFLMA